MRNLFVWLLAAAFLAARLFNIIGTPGTRGDFARWGILHGGVWSRAVSRSQAPR